MGRKTGHRGFFGRRKENGLQVLPYRIRDNFLSPEQASYFKMLLSAAGDTFAICPRVNLADIISVAQDEADHFKERLSGIQIDFLICDKDTLLPLAAVVLSRETEATNDLRERDYFLDDVFDAAKLPLVRFFTGNPYSPGDLRESLLEAAESVRPKSLDGLFPDSWTGLEKKAPPAKSKVWQQPEPSHQESEGHAEELLQEADLKQEEPQPEPEIIETAGEAYQERERYKPVSEEDLAPESTWTPPLKQPLEDLQQPQAVFMTAAEAAPLESAQEFLKEKHGAEIEKPKPLDSPAVLRFLHSEQEQTPGIDFFTGSLSDIPPPPEERMNAAEAGDLEFGPNKPSDVPSADMADGDDAQGPTAFFSAELPDLEQLKAKMKREVELAAQKALQSGAPECPRCTATMVLRTSRRGHRFYVCANYPHCREVKGLYE